MGEWGYILSHTRWLWVVALTLGQIAAAASGKEHAATRSCPELMQKLQAQGLLDTLKEAHERKARLYKLYMEKGGLLRSRAFQWAAAEAGAQNLENGKILEKFFDWKVTKSPEKLSEEIWRQMAGHYDLSFLAHGKVSAEESQKDSQELNMRLRRTGESQSEFLSNAQEFADIAADPAKLADLKKYIAENLPEYGKAAVRYEVARRMNAASLADLKSPWTIGLSIGTPVVAGAAAGYMGENPVLGAALGLGGYGFVKAWIWSKSFYTLMDAMRRDRRVTNELKKNMAKIDVEDMATQHGLDLNQYEDLIANAASKIYQPYKSVVDEVPQLELHPVEFKKPGALDKTLAEAADHYAAFGSAMAALSMPLRTEILRRSNEIMEAKRLGRLEKAIEPIKKRLATGETVSQADVKGLVVGALELRIEELKQQAKDMTGMEQDLRTIRDTARASHGAIKNEALRLFDGLDALEKAGTTGLEDRFEDFGRIDAEVKNFDDTAMTLEGATVALRAVRALIDAEFQAMQTLQNTIEINPGGSTGIIGDALIVDIERVEGIISDRKNYSRPSKPRTGITEVAPEEEVSPDTSAAETKTKTETVKKKAEFSKNVKPKPNFGR